MATKSLETYRENLEKINQEVKEKNALKESCDQDIEMLNERKDEIAANNDLPDDLKTQQINQLNHMITQMEQYKESMADKPLEVLKEKKETLKEEIKATVENIEKAFEKMKDVSTRTGVIDSELVEVGALLMEQKGAYEELLQEEPEDVVPVYEKTMRNR